MSYSSFPSGGDDEEAPSWRNYPHDEYDDNHQEDDAPPAPLCSVLTTVVDYVMVDPTPLEPREFYQQQKHQLQKQADDTLLTSNDPPAVDQLYGSITANNNYESTTRMSSSSSASAVQVPVIRVFGPIVRRDVAEPSDNHHQITAPPQSACLYIHGAFPYLLARPVVCGPDGGPNRFHSLSWEQQSAHTDWDDPDAVRAIVPILQAALEQALQNSLHTNNTTSSNKPPATTTTAAPRFIRQITVVVGRGFYTYCPGPAAPFLRVEYYNPAQRWRIKLALEHGLTDVPYPFYPSAKQYAYSDDGNDNNEAGAKRHGRDGDDKDNQSTASHDSNDDDAPPEALMFHCYEAHIPYSMQCFKRYNLAGLSYIHLEQALFRRDLPLWPSTSKWYRSSSSVGFSPTKNGSNVDDQDDEEEQRNRHFFLRSNTVSIWPPPPSDNAPNVDDNDHADDHAGDSVMDFQTVELLEHIPELHQATPPDDDPDETDTPSSSQRQQPLSSIPTQESSDPSEVTKFDLMSANLPGGVWSKATTSCPVELDTTVAHILNVNDVLTEKQADRDNDNPQQVFWRAVPSLETIWNQERRRMRKLLEPQHDFLSQQQPLQQPATPPLTLNVKDGAGHSGARLARQGMERLTRVTEGLHESHRRAAKDIVERHAAQIERVDADLLQATQQPPRQQKDKTSTTLMKDMTALQNGLTPTDDEALQALEALGDGENEDEEVSEEVGRAPLSSFSPWPGSQPPGDNDEGMEESEAMAPPLSQLATLFDDNASSARMRYSQASDNSSRPSDQPMSASERAEWALSQAKIDLTQKMGSGRKESKVDWQSQLVLTQRIDRGDGILDGSIEHLDEFIDPETLRPYEDLDDDETITEEHIDMDVDEAHHNGQEGDGHFLSEDGWQHGSQDIENVDDPAIGQSVETHESEAGDHDSSCSSPGASPDEADSHDNSLAELKSSTQQDNGIGHRAKPPSRGDFLRAGGTVLLPMERGRDQPSWLCHTKSYFRLYRSKPQSYFPTRLEGGRFSIVRTRPPPQRKAVASWMKRRRIDLEAEMPSTKKQRTGELDEKNVDTTDGQEVEEVEWRSSQLPLSLSQPLDGDNQSRPLDQMCQGGDGLSMSLTRSTPDDSMTGGSQGSQRALKGIGAQGGRLHIEGGGELKATTRASQGCNTGPNSSRELPTPVSVMVVEIHVQCRKGKDASSRPLALTPQPDRDRITAIMYVLAIDPGGGEALQVVERCCLLVPPSAEVEALQPGTEREYLSSTSAKLRSSMPSETLGKGSPLVIESFLNEKRLIHRFASLVQWKDPDLLCSWDTQGAGLGFLIERSTMVTDATVKQGQQGGIDLAKLLGRTPTVAAISEVDNHDDPFQINSLGAHGKMPMTDKKDKWKGSGMGAEWDERVGAGVAASSIVGRLVFASWKLVAEEVKHPNASYLQAVVFAVTDKRIPFHDNLKLTSWYSENRGKERWRVFHYRLVQAMSTIVLFDALDVIGRAGEAARLSGVELSHSFPGIRGSQYKVEGVLLRALQSLNSDERGSRIGQRPSSLNASASLSGTSTSQTQSPWKGRRSSVHSLKHQTPDGNSDVERLTGRQYFFYSPSLRAADRQESLQVQALTLEPKSGHYHDPVVVCDFTALYPSLVIAYNLCYSTISGHLEYHSTREEMMRKGRTTGKIGPFSFPEGRSAAVLKHHMRSLFSDKEDRAYVAPTGDIYVSETVVKGVLPQVLDEMLTTRAMLKKAAKIYRRNVKDLNPAVLRQLEARQLALKYVANVTYGYTSATFSGRCAMPLLADTIVECGRRTLTNAINLANSWGNDVHGRWKGCQVVYGDTDSVFIKLPGRSVEEAFQFGEAFCNAVTKNNPPPVQLKLEKVYVGSIMQTKKKYCGMKYESVDQKKPEFEAKGIETIRRDQCALTQKVLTNALKTLFSRGVPAVKDYLCRQWILIESGKLPVSDFILTGRVRSKYRASLPVQAALAKRLAEYDPGRAVRHKERLAYVIIASPGKAVRLSDAVTTPLELMEHWDLHTVNTAYYITKHVNAALQRCLSLEPHKIDVHQWYESAPKARKRIHYWPSTGKSAMISSFFGSDLCWFCRGKSKVAGRSHVSVCPKCRKSESKSVEIAMRRMNMIEKESEALAQKCGRCNLCFEHSGTFAAVEKAHVGTTGRVKGKVQTPLANCTCIDCPVLYSRHRTREDELELRAVFQALEIE